jgi:hypothetical protein
MKNEEWPPVRCTSMRGAWPQERDEHRLPASRNVQCSYFATAFFVDKWGKLWPRCEAHTKGWVRGGAPNPSDGAREISRDEYEVLLVHES